MESANSQKTHSGEWLKIGSVNDIPKLGARVVQTGEYDIAVFRTAADTIFALRDECPHKQGPLSQGIVQGDRVACPLHDWKINLESGNAVAPDVGCTATFPVKIENNTVFLSLQANEGCPNKQTT